MGSKRFVLKYVNAYIIILLIFFMFAVTVIFTFSDGELYPDSEVGIDEYLSDFEGIWDKHTYRKDSLSHVDSIISFYLMRDIRSNRVELGEDNWLFFNSSGSDDDGTFGDYTGKRTFTDEEYKNIIANMKLMDAYFKDLDIPYVVTYGPNKSSIYSEYVPEKYIHNQRSRTDILFDNLKRNGINVINPKEMLIYNKKLYPVYYQYDTHWNQIGAYTALVEVMSLWNKDVISLNDMDIGEEKMIYHTSAKDDLAHMIGMRDIRFHDSIDYIPQYAAGIDWTKLDDELDKEQLFCISSDDALYDERIFLAGDSFKVAMIPFLQYYFKEVFIGTLENISDDSIAQIKPDYVIIEVVERNSEKLGEITLN